MKIETTERGRWLRLSSGATLDPVMGVIGLSYDLTVHGGYDETIDFVDNKDASASTRTPLTDNDCVELADITPELVHITPNKIRGGRTAIKKAYKLTNPDGTRNDLGRAIDQALALRKTACGASNVIRLPAQSPLFLNNKGEAWTKSGFDSAWERTLAKAGIDRKAFHFHDLRAKTASDSETLAEAQERLGHTDSKTTKKIYRRMDPPIAPLNRRKGTA